MKPGNNPLTRFFSFLDRVIKVGPFLALGIPTRPGALSLSGTPPQGLVLLHTTDSAVEADLLRQVLIAEGFPIEYVPGYQSMFGMTGNTRIYVRKDQHEAAAAFLHDWLNAPTEHPASPE